MKISELLLPTPRIQMPTTRATHNNEALAASRATLVSDAQRRLDVRRTHGLMVRRVMAESVLDGAHAAGVVQNSIQTKECEDALRTCVICQDGPTSEAPIAMVKTVVLLDKNKVPACTHRLCSGCAPSYLWQKRQEVKQTAGSHDPKKMTCPTCRAEFSFMLDTAKNEPFKNFVRARPSQDQLAARLAEQQRLLQIARMFP